MLQYAYFKKIISIVLSLAILSPYNQCSVSAEEIFSSSIQKKSVSSKSYNTSDLAPSASTQSESFKDRFLATELLFSHEGVNAFIRRQIEKIISVRGEDGIQRREIILGGAASLMIAIPGLLKRTGQFAHIGLGSRYGKPAVYVDGDIFNNEADLAAVIEHESDEISRWEELRKRLALTPDRMRGWIIENIDLPVTAAALSGTAYSGLAVRDIARKIHESSYPLNALYQKYGNKINIRADYIAKLVTLYRTDGTTATVEDIFYDGNLNKDINIAAGPRKDAKGPKSADVKGAEDPNETERAKKVTWIEQNSPELKGKLIMSLSMEGNIPEFEGYDARDANTKGGLGAYFGDKLEGFADIGMNAIGVQPGYSHVMRGGKKIKVDYQELISKGVMVPVLTGKDAIMVRAWDEDPEARTEDEEDRSNPKVKVEVYKINRGGTTDYILMSKVLDILYTDDRVHRFTQEIVFGKAVYELTKRLKIMPDILHLNEAHTVVAAGQMRADEAFNRTAIIYTNHTIVAAGLETFPAGALKTDAFRMMYVIGLPQNKAERFRSVFLRPDGTVDFCYAASRLADVINGVSNEHAVATKKLFKTMYGEDFDVQVTGVLNGSGRTWKSDELLSFEAAGNVPTADELWRIHESGKKEALDEIERRTGIKLDRNKPTAWAVRRLVDYKSQYPMLRFLVHIMTADRDKTFTREELQAIWFRDIPDLSQDYNRSIVNSVLDKIFKKGELKQVNGLGMQLVIGGPEYMPYWVDEFKRWSSMDIFKGRFIYIPNSDAKLLKMQAIGADICITMPRPLEEACGTSDQRTGLNGGVNIAINGAGPIEWIEDFDEATGEGSGFLIGSYTRQTDRGAEADNGKFYHEAPADIFEKAVTASRLYYEDGQARWRHLMHNSYSRANKLVTAEAMEQRYARDVYVQALRNRTDAKTIYEISLRDYSDPATGTSGLRAAMKELSFLADAGVKQLYLLGLMEHAGNPFEILDPRKIDPRAGTFEDLALFMREADRAGIRVSIIDWISNRHLSKRSEFCSAHPDRFLYTNVSDGNYWIDRESELFKGRDIPADELRRRIELGRKISAKIQTMQKEGTLREEGEIEIGRRKIPYKIGNRDLRAKVSGIDPDAASVIVSAKDALFLVSATDMVSLKTTFPRRWPEVAQPDLSHPEVINDAIETGRFWLAKGIGGFRVDAALSTFPDRVKENWNIDVSENLTALFIREMRKINPDCFFLFEGFEHQAELLELAGNRNCAAYAWECRNLATEAMSDPAKINELVKHLRNLERMPRAARDSMVNLGPEHDASNFGDLWARLGYQDRNILYFLYSFLPGYRLIFNGEIYGTQHDFKHDQSISAPAPRIEDSDPARRDVRKTLFSLAKFNHSIISGDYRYLETDAPWNGIGVARFDDDEIVIGAFNLTDNAGWTTFDLKRLINMQVGPDSIGSTFYSKESLILDKDGKSWRALAPENRSGEELFKNGFSANVGPKGCEIIRLRRVANPSSMKGSPAEGLRSLYASGVFNGKSVTVKEFSRLRGFAETTVRAELDALVAVGLVEVVRRGRAYSYHLLDYFGRAPPDEASSAIDRISAIPDLNRYKIPDNRIPAISARIREILPEQVYAGGLSRSTDRINAIVSGGGLEKYTQKDPKRKAGSGRYGDTVKRDVEGALELLASDHMGRNLEDGTVYEIRYNESRLRESPFAVEILKAYTALLKVRCANEENIILLPSQKVGLITVYSYKNHIDRANGNAIGEGVVNMKGDISDQAIKIVRLVNMALAASGVRRNVPFGQLEDAERRLIEFIRVQCEAATGMAVPADQVIAFIKDLPRAEALPINRIEEYNRLTVQQLQQSA